MIRAKKLMAGLAAGALALWAASCDLAENGEPVHYLSILAPDTLLAYDTVVVLAMAPGRDSVLDTLWNAPLARIADLSRLPAGHYRGGAVDLLILGVKEGWAGYSLKAEYRGAGKPRLESSPRWDTLPPGLSLRGPDSAGFREGEAMPDTGADCVDEHPGTPRLTVTGRLDPDRAGLYELEYACRDRAGNVARAFQRFTVSRWPDTLAPELRHPADTLALLPPGTEPAAEDFACRDDRDSGLSPIRTGILEAEVPGEYRLAWHCADAAGNRSPEWILHVRVLPWPDRVPPKIALSGPDTVTLHEGTAFVDPGAECRDGEEDGVHYGGPAASPAERQGSVDPFRRGAYPLIYHCMDHAGNAASIGRWVLVVRAPDADPPALRLHGPDSAETYDHEPYADPGAECADARDGELTIAVTGQVDVARRGRYELGYACADSSGNAIRAARVVHVVRRPDGVAPVLALKGPDSLDAWEGVPYFDSGAVCRDDRDGERPVAVSDAIDTGTRGLQIVRFACADSAGNTAEALRRVRVVRRPDAVPPKLTLNGADTLIVYDGQAFADPGAACVDDRDGALAVSVTGKVEAGIRGDYPLAYACADSAGNAAERKRLVRVRRMPDSTRPELALRGPDSLDAREGEPYVDSGASCQDDRDGARPIAVTGSIDTGIRGTQSLRFACSDSAGNAAIERVRKVRVIRVPDPVKPVLTLLGSPSPAIIRGDAYVDAGATCLDDRDGNLPVTRLGSVDPSRTGIYPLKYACADSAGNQADTVARTVTVALPLDTAKPVLTLRGPDSIPVLSLSQFDDPGADCVDDRDGILPAVFAGFGPPEGTPEVPGDGIYHARYTCADKSGNAAEAFRMVKSGLYTTNLLVTQDASIDTTITWYNNGYTFVTGVCRASGDKYAGLYKFDLSKVDKAGLKSAKVRFPAWGRNDPSKWPAAARDYSFQLWAVRRAWTEGTGNWFFHRGTWQNGGEAWLAPYVIADSIKAKSSDPALADGITGADRDLIRPANVSLMATGKSNLRLYGAVGTVPPQDLRVIEIDVTDYVKRTDPAQDFGFYLVSPDEPDIIGILSREVEGGKYAMRLMLTY